MMVKGTDFTKQTKARSWFDKKFSKLYASYVRRIEKLISKAMAKGMDIDNEWFESIAGVANTHLNKYDANVSFNSETGEITGNIGLEKEET